MSAISTQSIWTWLGDDLRRFIHRRVNDAHVAEDLLQETFVHIHSKISQLGDSDRVVGWVYQIARNVVRDHYRQIGRSEQPLEDTDRAEDLDLSLEHLPCHPSRWLEELIHELPADYREAVELVEADGLTHQELADRLGISLAAAKARVQRGRKTLKSILTQCCDFEFDRRGNLVDIDPRSDRSVCQSCDCGTEVEATRPVIP